MNSHVTSTIDQTRTRNTADFPLLGVLMLGPAHGYDLCTELRKRLGEIWILRTSHVYALLTGLEKDGLIAHERIDQENRPAKKVFRITTEGRKVFTTWMTSPVSNVRDIRMEFFAKLYFARLESHEVAAKLIDDQLKVCRESAKRQMARKEASNVEAERAVLDYRLAMLKATVACLRRTRAALPVAARHPNHERAASQIEQTDRSRRPHQ